MQQRRLQTRFQKALRNLTVIPLRRLIILAIALTPFASARAQTTTEDSEIGLRDLLVILGEVGKAVITETLAEASERSDFFPEQVEVDENGKLRRLHDYFGEYRWSRDPLVAALPDDVMIYWYHQLARFNYDHRKISSDDATWQTVRYTWHQQRGVCRDSATVLADMLTYHDYDARLVLGYLVDRPGLTPNPNDGHAWVVVRDPTTGYEYILESTEETWDYNMRFPPRTYTAPEYLPVMQVTRNHYLTPIDSELKTSYTKGWSVISAD